MSTQKDVEKALNNRMAEYSTAYPIDVEYPNVKYTPEIGKSYFFINYLHAVTSQVEIGTDSADRATGIQEITISVESDVGSKEMTTLITQLKEYFKRGTVATYNGLNVRIIRFYLGSDSSDGDYYRQIINIVYRSDIAN